MGIPPLKVGVGHLEAEGPYHDLNGTTGLARSLRLALVRGDRCHLAIFAATRP